MESDKAVPPFGTVLFANKGTPSSLGRAIYRSRKFQIERHLHSSLL